MIADQVEAGRRNRERKPFEERRRLEHDVGGAVSPAPLQAIAEATVVLPGEPIGSERRAGDVSAQALEASMVPRGDGGVEAEAGFVRAARLGPRPARGEFIGLDPVTEAEQALARMGAGGDAALE